MDFGRKLWDALYWDLRSAFAKPGDTDKQNQCKTGEKNSETFDGYNPGRTLNIGETLRV